MTRRIRDSVIVITGASSGIGRAAALEFARRGGTVVLVARREQALRDVAEECEKLGGRALAAPADVSDEAAVKAVARQAIETFGRIDVWVNNAAVTLFGRVEETPYEAYRRVIETNLFGYVHGARAAIPYFREQGSGVLINVSSIVGKLSQPYTSAYCATKFAIIGLSESWRQELLDAPGIHVSTILPAAIDTPIFQHGANYTGRAVKAMTPVYRPEEVAQAIVQCAVSPQREVFVGNAGRMMNLLHTVFPALAEAEMARKVETDHFFPDRTSAPTSGNLFQPMPHTDTVRGGWRKESGLTPAGTLGIGLSLLAIGVGLACMNSSEEPEPRHEGGQRREQPEQRPGLVVTGAAS